MFQSSSLLVGVAVACVCWVLQSSTSAQQIMRRDLIKAYRSVFPKTNDPLLKETLESEDLILYTAREIEPRFQMTRFPNGFGFNGISEALGGHHSAYSNPSAEGDPVGHANGAREYPWGHSLGGRSHNADNLKTCKGLLLPKDNNGRFRPVAVFGSRPLRWVFPNGTRFVELAWVVRKGHWYPIEVRLREKEPNDWRTERYLPYQDRQDLVSFIAETDTALASMIESGSVNRMRIQSGHPIKAINSTARVQKLPAMDAAMVRRILARPFVPTAGWDYADDADGPTTDQQFAIRPRGDLTANHGSGERESCRQCHNTIGRSARSFSPRRGWYGTVRGSSGIFSWHPWGPSSRQNANPNQLRASWVSAGVVSRYDARVHTPQHYTRDAFLTDEIRRGVN